MSQPPIVKKSSLDVRAPDDVKIVYCLCYPPTKVGGRLSVPKPFFESEDPVEVERKSAELTRQRVNHMATTIWRDKRTNAKVAKWQRVRKGTRREYKLTIPWVDGISHDKVTAAVTVALAGLSPEWSSSSVTVTPLSPKGESGTM